MMHHSSGGGGRAAWASNDDYIAIGCAIILIGLGFFAYLAWDSYHAEISWSVFHLQHWKMQLIAHFTNQYAQQDASVLAAHPEKADIWQLLGLLNNIGLFFRTPVAVLMLLLALACYLRAAPSCYTRYFDLSGLRQEQAKYFRWAGAMLGRSLHLVRIGEGEPRPADPALRVEEWVERYAQRLNGEFNEVAATRALIRQLGVRWHGLPGAVPHVRCMFAIFALHLGGRREEALQFLGEMAEALPLGAREGAAGPAKPLAFPAALIRLADEVLLDPELRQPALKIANRHAYTTPALMSVLNEARRRSGVLAPASFNALKLVDRSLWYALHSLGFPGDGPGQNTHPNPRVEALGARDHWAAERAMRRPMNLPEVGQAVGSVRNGYQQLREREADREAEAF